MGAGRLSKRGAALLAACLLLAFPSSGAGTPLRGASIPSEASASAEQAPEFSRAADPPSATSLTPAIWIPVAPGIEFARVEALRVPHAGSAGIAVVRLDPARVRIEPYHEAEYPGAVPVTIDGWQKRLEAPVVVNAGLYDESRRHLGRLRRGRNRSRRDSRTSGGTGSWPRGPGPTRSPPRPFWICPSPGTPPGWPATRTSFSP